MIAFKSILAALVVLGSPLSIHAEDALSIRYEVNVVLVFPDEESLSATEIWETVIAPNSHGGLGMHRTRGDAIYLDSKKHGKFVVARRSIFATSAGTFDFLHGCLSNDKIFQYWADFAANFKACHPVNIVPRLLEVDSSGIVGDLEFNKETNEYQGGIKLWVIVSTTSGDPVIDLDTRLPWIRNLKAYEFGTVHPKVPENGFFSRDRYYQKDFTLVF